MTGGSVDFFATLYDGTATWFFYSTDTPNDPTIYLAKFNGNSLLLNRRVLRFTPGDTVAAGAVLASTDSSRPGPFQCAPGVYYRAILYVINDNRSHAIPEPPGGKPVTTGAVMYACSNDGLTWTAPQWVMDQTRGGALLMEDMSAVFDGFGIYVVGLEGDLPTLLDNLTSGRTLTYLYFLTAQNPGKATRYAELSRAGLYNPNRPGSTLYRYFINTAVTYDFNTGYVYVGRTYPYPYDHQDADFPCGNYLDGATPLSKPAPALYPVRMQIYRMPLGHPADLDLLRTGTWQLVKDWGHAFGYHDNHLSACASRPIAAPQQNIGLDINSFEWLKKPDGSVYNWNGRAVIYAGAVPNGRCTVGRQCDRRAQRPRTLFVPLP